jgi:NTE family protein
MSVRWQPLVISLLALWTISSCAHRETPPPPAPPKPAKIALALGAGAAKGFAHIGVLKILEANQIPIHLIVGTSAGSFVGSLYAFGYNAYRLQTLAIAVEKGEIIDWVIPDNGFIKGERLAEFVNRAVSNTALEQLKVPFYPVAADIVTGEEVVFGRGDTGTAVRASCSVPGVFRPVKIADRWFVDGGLVSPVPVEAARKFGGDIVIAVDISADVGGSRPETTVDTMLQSLNIMYSRLAVLQCSKADVLIKPKVGFIGSGDFAKRHEAIMEGEKAAFEALPKIKEIIERLRKEGRLP